MIKFLFSGLLRDKHRSLIPFLVTSTGVLLTVVFHAWLTGIINNSIEFNAKYSTGHVKIMTRAYALNLSQTPNDLAILDTDTLMDILPAMFPELNFAERIYFGGIVDVPDYRGETRAQGPAMGIGIDLLSDGSPEIERLNLLPSLKEGKLPAKRNEVLLSRKFAAKLELTPGDTLTLVSTTMFGEFTLHNFILSGTVEFGTTALDRGTIIADLQDAREALNMNNAAGEILGFLKTNTYDDDKATIISQKFNSRYFSEDDEFSLVMKKLPELNNLAFAVEYSGKIKGILVAVFITAMSLILWNAGLLGGLRRYGEFGMRLAIGEGKSHVYGTMMIESLIIGFFGSFAGTAIGLLIALYLQNKGLDLGFMMKNASIMMPGVFRAQITPSTWYIGFIPGFVSAQIGTMLAGMGIYKRQTSQLFKELEA
ncbi:MAG TPA: FtsX-like permease family protein [Bacteroidales bacterium]|nr:FtsX-like permease family protein [Bacteroidales bacterium]HRW86123.1 FtsX-like permease family protein [Bacteroidales bacterium]